MSDSLALQISRIVNRAQKAGVRINPRTDIFIMDGTAYIDGMFWEDWMDAMEME